DGDVSDSWMYGLLRRDWAGRVHARGRARSDERGPGDPRHAAPGRRVPPPPRRRGGLPARHPEDRWNDREAPPPVAYRYSLLSNNDMPREGHEPWHAKSSPPSR